MVFETFYTNIIVFDIASNYSKVGRKVFKIITFCDHIFFFGIVYANMLEADLETKQIYIYI